MLVKRRRIRRFWLIPSVGKRINVYKIFAGKSEGRRTLRIRRRIWVDNIKMSLKVIG
jgi:hypothetical protein